VALLLPSARSLLIAFALLAGAALAYGVARETAVFGVQRVDVRGASPAVTEQVERALAGVRGRSLVTVDAEDVRSTVEAVPTVAAASVDRSFPHTLTVRVLQERPVAVVRQGSFAFLVSARGRVMTSVEPGTSRRLARIWVPRGVVTLAPGATVTGSVREAVAAVSPLAGRRFPSQVVAVRADSSDLVLRLRSGLEIHLGDAADMRLKLVVARRVIPLVRPGTTYLDVSLPDRPVAGTTLYSQVEVEGSVSTGP
jgi:cell division protein FtsQ